MIGEDYLEFRARLGTVLFSLGRLADKVGVHPSRTPVINSVVKGLRDPFLFVVVGEVNAGKSTLLNAFFGEEMCAMGVLPTTDRINVFQYSQEPRTVDLGPTLRENYRSNSFLHDFHIVDTPGTNAIDSSHQIITEQFLPAADLVVFVMSVMNPWSGSTWELLERITGSWRRHLVLVLQQCDLRTPEEVRIIEEHVRFTAQKRLGQNFPIFPVSARKAYLARTTAVDRDRLFEESRFAPLEAYISRLVTQESRRMDKLANAIQTGRVLLEEVMGRLNLKAARLKKDDGVVEALESQITTQQARTREQLDLLIPAVERRFREASVPLAAGLKRRLSVRSSLAALMGKPEAMAAEVCGEYEAVLEGCARQPLMRNVPLIEEELTSLEKYVLPAVKKNLPPGADKPTPVRPREHTALYETHAAASARRVVGTLRTTGLQAGLAARLARRKKWLLIFLLALVLAGGLTIFTTWAGLKPFNYTSGLIFVAALACVAYFAQSDRYEIASWISARVDEACAGFQAVLNRENANLATEWFEPFQVRLEPLRQVRAGRAADHEGNLSELEAMAQAFNEMEAKLKR